MHYITITYKIIALHYNYKGFDNVMHNITIISRSNALHYNYLKGFKTLFIWNIIEMRWYSNKTIYNTKTDKNVRSNCLETV